MVERASIEFVEVSEPITEAVTKFGGQPVWLTYPQWPISRSTGRPMQFIGQIALYPDLFAIDKSQLSLFPDEVVSVHGGMAYLFVTDGDFPLKGDDVDGIHAPDGGENAVIVQPGDVLMPVQNIADGPSLYRMVPQPDANLLIPEPCEYAVRLTRDKDPDFVTWRHRQQWGKEKVASYDRAISGNKIGGTPESRPFEYFSHDSYNTLLLQLDASNVPFWLEFGHEGTGYVFLSSDRRSGKFFW